jgi:hypothetical protein
VWEEAAFESKDPSNESDARVLNLKNLCCSLMKSLASMLEFPPSKRAFSYPEIVRRGDETKARCDVVFETPSARNQKLVVHDEMWTT